MDEHFPRQMAYEETCVGKTIGFILGDRDWVISLRIT
jgi:hypothetical protein